MEWNSDTLQLDITYVPLEKKDVVQNIIDLIIKQKCIHLNLSMTPSPLFFKLCSVCDLWTIPPAHVQETG